MSKFIPAEDILDTRMEILLLIIRQIGPATNKLIFNHKIKPYRNKKVMSTKIRELRDLELVVKDGIKWQLTNQGEIALIQLANIRARLNAPVRGPLLNRIINTERFARDTRSADLHAYTTESGH